MVTSQLPVVFSVLFVEDDAIVCLAVARMITRQFPGSTVYTAENGQIGLELFKEHTPEIIITDINMPVMDGLEMARTIKSLKADTKFIVITGFSDKNHLDSFNEIGCDDYIVKPVDFGKLFAAIEKCRIEIKL
jgi:YesN/AraC family two-component response regulator